MDEQNKPQSPLQMINTGDEMSRGRFSNTMIISHSPEEFMIDWLLSSPSGTHLVSRIIVSPGHVKRIISALNDNLIKYEQKFGKVKDIEPDDQKFH
jgi:hypothetical protein